MHKASQRCFAAALLLMSLLACQGQVFSVALSGGPPWHNPDYRVDEHKWTIGRWPALYGLVQYRYRATTGSPWAKYTEIHYGADYRSLIAGTPYVFGRGTPRTYTIKLPAFVVIATGVAGLLLVAWFAIFLTPAARRRHRRQPPAA
jgi:hypothetical protein